MKAQPLGWLGLSLASALLGAMLAPAAFGQNAPAGPPLYRVEIIVFARNGANPAEEDFAHIARREAASGTRTTSDEIAEFDFGPYVPPAPEENRNLLDDPDVLSSARSRLLLGPDPEPEDGESAVAGDSAGDAPVQAAEAPGPSDVGTADLAPSEPAGPAAPGPAQAAAGASEPEVVDPLGPRNVVAPFRFRLLRQDELELVNVRRQLDRSYTALVHGGWIQEGLPQQQARPFDLAYLGASAPSGTIRLHISRFPHLTLDLDFRPDTARRRADSGETDGGAPGAQQPVAGALGGLRAPLTEVEVSRRYHLNAERRVRSGEVHYFDHPFFGVIAVVKPYEPPAPPPTEGVRPAA